MPPRPRLSSLSFRSVPADSYVCPSCRLYASIEHSPAIKQPRRHHTQSTSSSVRPILTNGSLLRHSRTRNAGRIINQHPTLTRRSASDGTLASRSAVNAPSSAPQALRELHQLLLQLQDKAGSYVDLSRVQLALRSLESHDPVVRVAFLGLGSNGLQAARKLAKVLLSDALGSEEEWERDLLAGVDERGVLLRYGESVDAQGVQGGSSTLQTLNIPSPFLQKYNLEIMIAPLNAYEGSIQSPESVRDLEEAILVPPVAIPTSAGGRVGFVRYPVHNALIIAEGINGAVEYGRFPSSLTNGRTINAALSLPLRSSTGVRSSEEVVTGNAIDVDLADHAIGIFRASSVNGPKFGEEWQTSRVGVIANWLSACTGPVRPGSQLKPAVEALVLSILARSTSSLSAAESVQTASATSLTVPDAQRTSLQSALSDWAEEAHRDLQVNLSTALVSPTWRRTTWWRLFWRIDEVSLSASDVLRRGWLVEAEQNLAFLSGRVVEAGVASPAQLKSEQSSSSTTPTQSTSPEQPADTTTSSPAPATAQGLLTGSMRHEIAEYKAAQRADAPPQKLETVAELMQLPPMLARVHAASGLDALFDPPWPRSITLARQRMLHRDVPALHRAAQGLLLTALSTVGGSAALAAWLWAASGGVAAYEAGAVAALGLVWGLRRLQRRWGKERAAFVTTAREDGRRVLADVEARLTALVRDGGRAEVSAEDRRAWLRAREAIDACLVELDRVGKK